MQPFVADINGVVCACAWISVSARFASCLYLLFLLSVSHPYCNVLCVCNSRVLVRAGRVGVCYLAESTVSVSAMEPSL